MAYRKYVKQEQISAIVKELTDKKNLQPDQHITVSEFQELIAEVICESINKINTDELSRELGSHFN